MASTIATAPASPAVEAGNVFLEALAASRFNRDLRRLTRLLTELRDRLDQFTGRDPVLELVEGMVARGLDRATAVSQAVEFAAAFDGSGEAHRVALSLVWTLEVAADVLGGMVAGPG